MKNGSGNYDSMELRTYRLFSEDSALISRDTLLPATRGERLASTMYRFHNYTVQMKYCTMARQTYFFKIDAERLVRGALFPLMYR